MGWQGVAWHYNMSNATGCPGHHFTEVNLPRDLPPNCLAVPLDIEAPEVRREGVNCCTRNVTRLTQCCTSGNWGQWCSACLLLCIQFLGGLLLILMASLVALLVIGYALIALCLLFLVMPMAALLLPFVRCCCIDCLCNTRGDSCGAKCARSILGGSICAQYVGLCERAACEHTYSRSHEIPFLYHFSWPHLAMGRAAHILWLAFIHQANTTVCTHIHELLLRYWCLVFYLMSLIWAPVACCVASPRG